MWADGEMWADVQPGLKNRCCQNWEQPRWVQEAWISVRMVQMQSLTIVLLAKHPRACHAERPLVQRALWTQTLPLIIFLGKGKKDTKKPIQSKHLNWVSAQSKRETCLCTEQQLSSPSPWVLEFRIKISQVCINHSDRHLLALSLHTYKESLLGEQFLSLQKWVIIFIHKIFEQHTGNSGMPGNSSANSSPVCPQPHKSVFCCSLLKISSVRNISVC